MSAMKGLLVLLLSVAFAADLGAVEGRTLAGDEVSFAAMIDAELTLLVVPFERDQTDDMLTWYEPAEQLPASLAVTPLLPRGIRALRRIIDRGMAKKMSRARQRRTATFYVDKDPLKEHLGIEVEDELAILLLARDGRVLFRGTGPWTSSTEAALRAALASEGSP